MENPLPGAKLLPPSRSRKTKPQAILYNDESDQVYEMLPDGSLASITAPTNQKKPQSSGSGGMMDTSSLHTGDGPIDVNEFASQLDPHDIETLETVLQSEQAQEILANLDLGGHGHAVASTEPETTHLWDHSYSTSTSQGQRQGQLAQTTSTMMTPTGTQHSMGGTPRTTISVDFGPGPSPYKSGAIVKPGNSGTSTPGGPGQNRRPAPATPTPNQGSRRGSEGITAAH
jgi:hypothetical protein